MLKPKDVIQFRSLLKPGAEHELLMFVAKVWSPKGSAEVVVRSVDMVQCLVLELIDDSGHNSWLSTSLKDSPIYKYLHSSNGHYTRFVLPLALAGWIKHRNYDTVDRAKHQWITISDRVVYRRQVR